MERKMLLGKSEHLGSVASYCKFSGVAQQLGARTHTLSATTAHMATTVFMAFSGPMGLTSLVAQGTKPWRIMEKF